MALRRIVLLVEDVALGDHADDVALDVADGQAGDAVLDQDLRHVLERCLWPDREDVLRHHLADSASLLLRLLSLESSRVEPRGGIRAGAERAAGNYGSSATSSCRAAAAPAG